MFWCASNERTAWVRSALSPFAMYLEPEHRHQDKVAVGGSFPECSSRRGPHEYNGWWKPWWEKPKQRWHESNHSKSRNCFRKWKSLLWEPHRWYIYRVVLDPKFISPTFFQTVILPSTDQKHLNNHWTKNNIVFSGLYSILFPDFSILDIPCSALAETHLEFWDFLSLFKRKRGNSGISCFNL